MSVSGHVNYNLHYRSTKDDAWYNCAVLLEHGNRLRVKFKGHEQTDNDEVFSVSDFSTNDEIEAFRRRFRPESESVGDNECARVAEGVMICATAADSRDKQPRYFDAIVDAVCNKEHTPEKCLCTYFLFWQHGPEEGNTTEANLDDIYLIKSGSVDPAVVNFTKLVKDKVKGASFEFTLIPKNSCLFKGTGSNETITKSQEFGSAGHSSHVGFSTGKDLGGEKETNNHHYLILENLEKDLCPLLMMDFIRERTLITAETYIFPNSLSEVTYARGAILVDNKTNLKKIYEYITNPNHLIVSSSGRPWVIAEDKLRTGKFNTNLHSFRPKPKNYNTKNDLTVVRLGTEEYTKAKQLKDLYLGFRNHLNGLVQRLAMEEKKSQCLLSAN